MKPLFCQTKFNPQEKAFDVVLMIGGYKTKDAADKDAIELLGLVKRADGAWEPKG